MRWRITGSLMAAVLVVSCAGEQGAHAPTPIVTYVHDADALEKLPLPELPELPEHALSPQELREVVNTIKVAGEIFLGDRPRRSQVRMNGDGGGWGQRRIPRFIEWLEQQGCVKRASVPSVGEEGDTAYMVLTSLPAQLPLLVDFRVRLESGTEEVEPHRLSLYLDHATGMRPLK